MKAEQNDCKNCISGYKVVGIKIVSDYLSDYVIPAGCILLG